MSERTYQYTRWDYDNDTVQTLERSGECNGCGLCCKAIIKITTMLVRQWSETPKNGGSYMGDSGVWHEITNDKGARKFMKITAIDTDAIADGHVCPSLMEQNGKGYCNHHFEKTLICEAWPMAPEHVTPFEGCSYSFTVTSERRISDMQPDEWSFPEPTPVDDITPAAS